MFAAVPFGLLVVLAMLSEQVSVTNSGITVGHPSWCSWLLRRGWSLKWTEMKALVPVGTSQGGKVFYITTHEQLAAGVSSDLIRLSVGLENIDDLKLDLKAAFSKIPKEVLV